ncbi:MAG: GTPase HflX [Aestuariivirgaceae bacterium]
MRGRNQAASGGRTPASRLSEATGLSSAIDLAIVDSAVVTLATPHPATLLGPGKVAEIATVVEEDDIELVVINAQLAPGQQRNLERAFKAKVVDRTGLILEIFGERARTREGALQVELAHLEYQKSRLVRSWTHLERQRGGFGFLGGPGETQLETDRRLIQERIARIERDLEQVKRTRGLHRKKRDRVPYPVVALVGYTNAGKSTLFNALTHAGVDARDLLFATLDPTMRQVTLPHGRRIILSDTVGFISDLPTTLVAAFRATLEEVIEAAIVLHVRDIAHEESAAQASDVEGVLGELGLDEERRSQIIEVWNKVDLVPPDRLEVLREVAERQGGVIVSAVTGEGLDQLLGLIERRLAEALDVVEILLAASDGENLAWVYEHGEVLSRQEADGAIRLVARFDAPRLNLAERRFGEALRRLDSARRAAE